MYLESCVLGGFESLQTKHYCKICHSIPLKSKSMLCTPCDQIYCSDCVDLLNELVCICSSQINSNQDNQSKMNEYSKLKFQCFYKCTKILTYSSFEDHFHKCNRVIEQCKNCFVSYSIDNYEHDCLKNQMETLIRIIKIQSIHHFPYSSLAISKDIDFASLYKLLKNDINDIESGKIMHFTQELKENLEKNLDSSKNKEYVIDLMNKNSNVINKFFKSIKTEIQYYPDPDNFKYGYCENVDENLVYQFKDLYIVSIFIDEIFLLDFYFRGGSTLYLTIEYFESIGSYSGQVLHDFNYFEAIWKSISINDFKYKSINTYLNDKNCKRIFIKYQQLNEWIYIN